ncbi:hypothetical protein KAZ66_03250 [Candidatus Woesebacteria bacterium]|nr:hypothetical protein [Candidatus Woesebacteria bacterium]
MNEQNIQNIIAYFTQNPTQSQEVLVQNLLASGYPRIDIDEALNRIGISPEILPETTVDPKPVPKKTRMFHKKYVFITLFVIIILGGIFAAATFIKQNTQLPSSVATPTESVAQPTATIVPLDDPLQETQSTLLSGIYKVSINQHIIDTDPANDEQSVLIYYFDKGSIVRFEHSSGPTIVLQTDTVFSLDTVQKTYTSYAATKSQQDILMSTLDETDIIKSIINKTEQGVYEWQKIQDTAWKGKNKNTNHLFNVQLDPTTRLLKAMDEYDEKNTKLSESIITIEPTVLDASLLTVPADFTPVEYELQ